MTVILSVLDNGSTDGTKAFLNNYASDKFIINHQQSDRPGKSRALNRAIESSTAEILLFSDDDIEFPSNWLLAMSEPIVARRADALTGRIQLSDEVRRPWMDSVHLGAFAETTGIPDPPSLVGANMSVRLSALLDHQIRFDERIGPPITGGGEDTLLGIQLQRVGCKLSFVDSPAVIHHPDPRRFRPSSMRRSQWINGKTSLYVAHKLGIPNQPSSIFWLIRSLLAQWRERIRTARSWPWNEGVPSNELSTIHRLSVAFHSRFGTGL